MNGLWDHWPQPVYGPGFAGSATTSAWKEVFWTAIMEGRCLGFEDDLEEEAFKASISNVIIPQQELRERRAKQYLNTRVLPMCCGRQRATDAMEFMESAEARIKGDEIFVELDKPSNALRESWIHELRHSWIKAQSKFRPVVGSTLPLVFDDSGNMVMLYMIDTSELGGHAMDTMAAGSYTNVWINTGEGKAGTLKVIADAGTEINISLLAFPLYQVAFSLKAHEVFHVIRRRIWAKTHHIEAPLRFKDLQRLSETKIEAGGVHFENPYSLEDDDILTIGLFRGQMADYTHTYPNVARSAKTVHDHPTLLKMWEKIMKSTWSEPGEISFSLLRKTSEGRPLLSSNKKKGKKENPKVKKGKTNTEDNSSQEENRESEANVQDNSSEEEDRESETNIEENSSEEEKRESDIEEGSEGWREDATSE
mmetsp:Transcript_20276/g.55972  ORF Transcript_20276/g.55972 Transcript_20276/m.55972 type:complete len:423 (-) Transcript_20276:2031-3299(-)